MARSMTNLFARSSLLAFLTLTAAAAAACSSTSQSDTSDHTGSGSTTGSDGGSDAAPAATCAHGQVWKASSALIEVSSFGFWQGSTGYIKKSADLTTEQAAALDALCVIPEPTGPVVSDFNSYTIRITDTNGATTTYRATDSNVPAGTVTSSTPARIDYGSLRPYLATIHCVTAGQTRLTTGASDDAGTPPWSKAPTLSDDEACQNGLFAPYSCADVWLKFQVDAPATYDLALTRCFGSTRLHVFSEDGATELASGAASTEPACASVEYAFPKAGTFLVKLEKTNPAGCDSNGGAGDMTIVVRKP